MKVALTIRDFLDRASLVYGNRIGIFDEPDQVAQSLGDLTYRQLARMAGSLASTLDAMQIGFGQRVAIVSKNAARMLVSFFGVSGFGRVLVPINFRLTRDEIAYIVEHSGAVLLLVDAELAESLSDIPCTDTIVLDEQGDGQLFFNESASPIAWDANEDATATINYTSGTTAKPKGVQLTHRSLWINATVFGLHAGLTDRDVYLHTLPMFHANGWGMPYISAGLGVPQVVLRQVDGAEILRRVEKHGVTIMCGAPTVASMILDAAADWNGPIPGRGKVRIIVAGAAPPTQIIERIEQELGWEFIQIYGLTETSPLLTMSRSTVEDDESSLAERAKKLGNAGPPTLGVSITTDEQGEVLARGNVVLEGYWRNEQATNDALRNGWFRTGDGGQVDENSVLSISDRKKDVIISGGENISSLEVEDVLFSHQAVKEVAVIGVPHEKWGETVKALVVLQSGSEITESQLIEFCKDRMARFKCPTSIEFTDALPRTATGKLQKYKLRALYHL
jgi:acyl-CoA synthetase (AMP-forming)/AMP-acid ligase II